MESCISLVRTESRSRFRFSVVDFDDDLPLTLGDIARDTQRALLSNDSFELTAYQFPCAQGWLRHLLQTKRENERICSTLEHSESSEFCYQYPVDPLESQKSRICQNDEELL